jgi:hypothetical protein
MNDAEAATSRARVARFLNPARTRFLWLLVLIMAMAHVALALQLWRNAVAGYGDFSAFYTAGKLVSQDAASLYDFQKQGELRKTLFPAVKIQSANLPFYHPAFEVLLYAPLATLPYPWAYLSWAVANLLMLALALWWLRPFASQFSYPSLLLLAIAFFPIAAGLLQGQDTVLLLLIYAASFQLLHRDRFVIAGLVLSLGLFKFHLVVPFVIVLAAQRRWKSVLGFSLGGAALAAISIALAGVRGTWQYMNTLLHFDALTREATGNLDSQMPSLGGFLTTIWNHAGLGHLSGLVILLATAAIVTIAAYLARHAGRDVACTFAFALVTAVLAGHHTNAHDLVLLFPALLVASMRANRLNQRFLLGVLALLWCSPLYLFLVERDSLTIMFLPIATLFVILGWQLQSSTARPRQTVAANA